MGSGPSKLAAQGPLKATTAERLGSSGRPIGPRPKKSGPHSRPRGVPGTVFWFRGRFLLFWTGFRPHFCRGRAKITPPSGLRPRGSFKGPRGPLKGPRGPFKGPRGPLKAPARRPSTLDAPARWSADTLFLHFRRQGTRRRRLPELIEKLAHLDPGVLLKGPGVL